MKATLVLTTLAACSLLASIAGAKDQFALTVSFRGGGLVRDDHGYLADARAFQFDLPPGGGGAFEVGFEFFPRLSLMGSLAGYSSSATRGDQRLFVSSSMWLFQVRYAPWRHSFRGAEVMMQAEAAFGAGGYLLRDRLEDTSRPGEALVKSDRAGGFRVGADYSIYWRWLGAVIGYGFHRSPAYVADRLGGSLRAGGHELTAGVSLRF